MDSKHENTHRTPEVMGSIAALLLFGLLFTVTDLFRSPFIVFGVVIFVLYPFRRTRMIKTILTLSVIIFSLWVLHSISGLLAPFIAAFIISYALNPVVEYMTRKKISRTLASALILLVFIIVITTSILLLAPPIAHQFSELIKSLPAALKNLQGWIDTVFIPKLESWGIPKEDIQNKLSQELPSKLENILNSLLSSLSGIFAGLSVILTQVVNLILIPFLTFYIMKDFDNVKMLVKEMFPPHA